MSLLMDALKKAELAKRQGEGAGEPPDADAVGELAWNLVVPVPYSVLNSAKPIQILVKASWDSKETQVLKTTMTPANCF